MGSPQDVLLTGLPRSGTTMTCHLLNKLPNNVALDEPMAVSQLATLIPDEFVAKIRQFFIDQRAKILNEGKATSKAWKGTVPTNHGPREAFIDGKEIEVHNVEDTNFNVYVKHPAFFTAALPTLASEFRCFALVRNPLSVLLSWRTSGMPVADGRMPAAQRFDPSLSASLEAESDVLSRQLVLIDYCFNQYARHLPEGVIRYEDIIASRGKALSAVTPDAVNLEEELSSRNNLGLKSDPAAIEIANKLVSRESPCWDFYSRDDVLTMIN